MMDGFRGLHIPRKARVVQILLKVLADNEQYLRPYLEGTGYVIQSNTPVRVRSRVNPSKFHSLIVLSAEVVTIWRLSGLSRHFSTCLPAEPPQSPAISRYLNLFAKNVWLHTCHNSLNPESKNRITKQGCLICWTAIHDWRFCLHWAVRVGSG